MGYATFQKNELEIPAKATPRRHCSASAGIRKSLPYQRFRSDSNLRVRSMAPTSPIAMPAHRTKGRITALQCMEGSAHSAMTGPGIAAHRNPRSEHASESPLRSPSSVSNMRTMARMAMTAPIPSTAREAQRQLAAASPCTLHMHRGFWPERF